MTIALLIVIAMNRNILTRMKKKSKKTLKLLKKLKQKYLKIKKNFKKPNKAIIDYINNSSN